MDVKLLLLTNFSIAKWLFPRQTKAKRPVIFVCKFLSFLCRQHLYVQAIQKVLPEMEYLFVD